MTRSRASPTAATRATSRRRRRQYLAGTGIADTSYFGPEAEFYIFDDVRYDYQPNGSLHQIDSIEAAWNTARNEAGGNLGYKPRYKGGYFPVPPTDHFTDLRSEMVKRAHRRPASTSRCSTTRSAPPARRRSTSASTPC